MANTGFAASVAGCFVDEESGVTNCCAVAGCEMRRKFPNMIIATLKNLFEDQTAFPTLISIL